MLLELSDADAYELFRAAIVGRSEAAWETIYTQYHPMMVGWSRYYCNKSLVSEAPEDIAARAFSRAWAALTPAQFAEFQNIAALLAYLRSCVAAAVIDEARSIATRERICLRLQAVLVHSPEEELMAAVLREELWLLLGKEIHSLQQHVVLYDVFVLGMAPRNILARHHNLFASVQDVYALKRNLLTRLGRCAPLKQLYNDLAP